ncbi:MAG TPA: glycogen synthase [Candidatus Binatia bacterium]|nr:glycogen synthase [Candidatus Binatia bacterium]
MSLDAVRGGSIGVGAAHPGRLRVGILTREFPPEVYGGAGVHVDYLSRALAPHVDVAVHCFGEPRDSPLVAATYRPWRALEGGRPEDAALGAMSVDLAMADALEGLDIVHSHTWYANLAGHLAKLLWEVPHVCTTHSLEPLRPWKAEQLGGGYALSLFCERTALESADAVIAVSEAMRRDVLAVYPAVDPDRVHVIHNGIDATEYRPTGAGDALTRHGIDPDRPLVVFVGRITRQKGLPHLLNAAPDLDRSAQLVLVASSPDTPEIAAEVRALYEAAREVGESVVWIDSMLPHRDLVALLSHAQVFVCPSVYEPFGLVNLEAMACETAVVASAVGGIPEIVVDAETGYLIPCDPGAIAADVSAARRFEAELATGINALIADRRLAAEMGRAGRSRVLRSFTWERIAAETAGLYRSLVTGADRTQ